MRPRLSESKKKKKIIIKNVSLKNSYSYVPSNTTDFRSMVFGRCYSPDVILRLYW